MATQPDLHECRAATGLALLRNALRDIRLAMDLFHDVPPSAPVTAGIVAMLDHFADIEQTIAQQQFRRLKPWGS